MMPRQSATTVFVQRRVCRCVGAAAVLLFHMASVSAQVPLPSSIDPGAIQRRTMELDQQLQEGKDRQPSVLNPLDKSAPPPPARFQSLTARFNLKRIDFTPSEILKPEELASFAQEFEGKEVSMADLQRLLDQINQRYRESGVVTAQAVLPPQDVVDGIVKIRLVEGRIGKIAIEGAKDTRGDYVTAWIKQAAGGLPDISALENDLIRFNRTNDAQLAAELKPGKNFGESDVRLKLAEPLPYELSLFVDNLGSYSTGELRSGVQFQRRSLFGVRDGLGLSYSRARGHDGYGLNYSLPVNTWGTRLATAYNSDKTHVVYGPFADLDITGEAESYGADLQHPLYFDSRRYLEGSIGLRSREVLNWISGIPLQETRTDDQHVALSWQSVDDSGYWNAFLTYVSGRVDNSGAQGKNYHLARGNVRRTQELATGWSLRSSVSFQAARTELLPPSEQFMVGGEGSVRGYQMGLYSGDSGHVVSVELHHPVPLGMDDQAKLTGHFFVDYGVAKPYRPVGSDRGADEIVGAGWGAILSVGKRVTTRVSFGFPLRDRLEEKKNYYITAQVVAVIF